MISLKSIVIQKIPLFALYTKDNIEEKAMRILGASKEKSSGVYYYPAYYPFGGKVFNQILDTFGDRLIVDESVYQRRLKLVNSEKMIKEKKLDANFKFATAPREHQILGLLFGITNIRFGLFWECGMGKTKTATDIARYVNKNVLYLCPARLVENTEDEIHKHSFTGEFEVVPLLGASKKKKTESAEKIIETASSGKKMIAIVGYESLSNYYPYIDRYNFDVLICDESHKLRSPKSQVSVNVANISRKAYRRLLMTGTPSLGNPEHLFVQMKILLPWMYPNYYSFRHRFIQFSPYNKHIVVGFKNLDILRGKIEEFSDQKTKEECLDLPERTVHVVNIKMSNEQIDMYNQVVSGTHASVEYNPTKLLIAEKLHQVCGGTLRESPIDYTICTECEHMPRCIEYRIMPFSNRCNRKDIERNVTNHYLVDNPKLAYLLELLDTIVKGENKKAIVWYMYENEHKILTEALHKEKFEYLDYGKLGHDAVRKFEKEDCPKIFLAQIQSSSGITLNAATYTIYYSLTFDLEHYLQSRDRNYRDGQTKKVFEYHLLMEKAVDVEVSTRLQKRIDINYALLKQDLNLEKISKIALK